MKISVVAEIITARRIAILTTANIADATVANADNLILNKQPASIETGRFIFNSLILRLYKEFFGEFIANREFTKLLNVS